MIDNNLFEIYDSKGKILKMELVFSFEFNGIKYIIYKEINSEQLYAAKFIKNINEDFDSNLTKEELEMCNKVYEELRNDKN